MNDSHTAMRGTLLQQLLTGFLSANKTRSGSSIEKH